MNIFCVWILLSGWFHSSEPQVPALLTRGEDGFDPWFGIWERFFRRQWFNVINNPSGNETGGKKKWEWNNDNGINIFYFAGIALPFTARITVALTPDVHCPSIKLLRAKTCECCGQLREESRQFGREFLALKAPKHWIVIIIIIIIIIINNTNNNDNWIISNWISCSFQTFQVLKATNRRSTARSRGWWSWPTTWKHHFLGAEPKQWHWTTLNKHSKASQMWCLVILQISNANSVDFGPFLEGWRPKSGSSPVRSTTRRGLRDIGRTKLAKIKGQMVPQVVSNLESSHM